MLLFENSLYWRYGAGVALKTHYPNVFANDNPSSATSSEAAYDGYVKCMAGHSTSASVIRVWNRSTVPSPNGTTISGTVVTVRNLFHNMPVRQKAIRQRLEREEASVREYVQRMSVLHHDISWTLVIVETETHSATENEAAAAVATAASSCNSAMGITDCQPDELLRPNCVPWPEDHVDHTEKSSNNDPHFGPLLNSYSELRCSFGADNQTATCPAIATRVIRTLSANGRYESYSQSSAAVRVRLVRRLTAQASVVKRLVAIHGANIPLTMQVPYDR